MEKISAGSAGSVGLIGCGTMGKCILKSLINAGYSVAVYDAFPAAQEYARGISAETARTPVDVARQCKIILLSLPGPAQIESVIFGEDGLFSELTSKHIIADTSTTSPDSTRSVSARVHTKGAAYLDCPILGRPSAVGNWLLPTGGDSDALEQIRAILLTFARDAVLVGKSGSGNALKLLNQMMFSAINAISSEVMAICECTGVDRKVFYETVSDSGAATVSGLFKEVGKNIVADNFNNPTFTVDLLIKDTNLALQMAKDANAPSLIAGTVQLYNELASAGGYGKQDTSALYKVFHNYYSTGEIAQ